MKGMTKIVENGVKVGGGGSSNANKSQTSEKKKVIVPRLKEVLWPIAGESGLIGISTPQQLDAAIHGIGAEMVEDALDEIFRM